MPPKNQPLVVVITGASSGIGRATAHAFARRGASLVLAARRAEMLGEVERECAALGATTIGVPTDVTDEAQVEALGRRALERFGRTDVWFNNAGVGIFGRFEDLPTEAWKRVIETNVLGYVHGAKIAMRQFRQQGEGVLIQNASIVGRTAKPDSTAYATSKFAVRGFSEALRMEVLDQPGIHVCTVLPSVIDTPFFEHAANFSHHKVRAAPPVYAPEKVVGSWRKRPNNGGVPLAATLTHGRLRGRNRPAGVRFCEPRPHPRQAGGERSDDDPRPAAGGGPRRPPLAQAPPRPPRRHRRRHRRVQ